MEERCTLTAQVAGSIPASPAMAYNPAMRIITARPPNYAAIVEAIPSVAKMVQRGVLFCYGDAIYNPANVVIHPSILRHEGVHSVRQGGDPERWWRDYLADPKFRFAEELPAHVAEYWWHKEREKNRDRLARQLAIIAARLASPLYGGLVTPGEAMRRIRTA